jgi:RNA recognition motif-containing protein
MEPTMKNIYVGNLDPRCTEGELRTQFEVYGKVDKAEIMRDRDSGQPRGFAFVEMTVDAEGEKAIAGLNGSLMEGSPLTVNEARPKRDRAPSNGGRGRSGGGGRY